MFIIHKIKSLEVTLNVNVVMFLHILLEMASLADENVFLIF